MAFMNKEGKAELAPGIKAILKKYKMKGSIAVQNFSTLVVNIKSGPLNIAKEESYVTVNQYWLSDHYTGDELAFLQELHDAMSVGNYNRSDAMSDYFDVGWYTTINVGKWNKPFILTV